MEQNFKDSNFQQKKEMHDLISNLLTITPDPFANQKATRIKSNKKNISRLKSLIYNEIKENAIIAIEFENICSDLAVIIVRVKHEGSLEIYPIYWEHKLGNGTYGTTFGTEQFILEGAGPKKTRWTKSQYQFVFKILNGIHADYADILNEVGMNKIFNKESETDDGYFVVPFFNSSNSYGILMEQLWKGWYPLDYTISELEIAGNSLANLKFDLIKSLLFIGLRLIVNSITHRDIKAANIICIITQRVDNTPNSRLFCCSKQKKNQYFFEGQMKLIDFGMSTYAIQQGEFQQNKYDKLIMNGVRYPFSDLPAMTCNLSTDIYALAIVLLQVIYWKDKSGYLLFPESEQINENDLNIEVMKILFQYFSTQEQPNIPNFIVHQDYLPRPAKNPRMIDQDRNIQLFFSLIALQELILTALNRNNYFLSQIIPNSCSTQQFAQDVDPESFWWFRLFFAMGEINQKSGKNMDEMNRFSPKISPRIREQLSRINLIMELSTGPMNPISFEEYNLLVEWLSSRKFEDFDKNYFGPRWKHYLQSAMSDDFGFFIQNLPKFDHSQQTEKFFKI